MLGCGQCVYQKNCKREGAYTFYKPWFVCDRFCHNVFCKEFLPMKYCKSIWETWENADAYKQKLEQEGVVFHKHVAYTLGDNVIYLVRMQDFYEGNMIRSDGKFNACAKEYYVKTRINGKTWTRIVRENIDGADIKVD